MCDHELHLARGIADGFRFRVAVCSKCKGAWPDGRMAMPWTMREPCWMCGEDGSLTSVPDPRVRVEVLPPELRATPAPSRERR